MFALQVSGLHLGCELLVPIEGQTMDLESNEDVKFNQISILKNTFTLKPAQFILGTTFEKFQVPRNIVCHVDRRNTVGENWISYSLHFRHY